jgi:hypothetical protein
MLQGLWLFRYDAGFRADERICSLLPAAGFWRYASPRIGIEVMEATAIAQPVKQRRRGEGRPFPKGVSGNPRGDVAKTIRERAAEPRAVIVADFGDEARNRSRAVGSSLPTACQERAPPQDEGR